MNRKFLIIFIYLLFICVYTPCIAGNEKILKAGDSIPEIKFDTQFIKDELDYLGFTDNSRCSLKNIKADFVLIEVFSIYCPVCQSRANEFVALYKLIQADPVLCKKVKMIGIGAGNNLKEISYFKNYYKIPIPLIPDPSFKLHKAFHETRTPLIIIIDKKREHCKVLSIIDFNKKPDEILKEIRKLLKSQL